MCDYSLEMYQSRPARAGERYETHRFPSGTVGFVAPGDPTVAVCMACDTELELERIPRALSLALGIADKARATFVRMELGPHHDAVRFANGAEISLQRLGPGISAQLAGALQADDRLSSRPLVAAE